MSWLFDLVKEIPLSSVLKEKLSTADERIKALEAENATLREKDSNSHIRIQQLEQQVAESYKTQPLIQDDILNETRLAILLLLNKSSADLHPVDIERELSKQEITLKAGELSYHLNFLTHKKNFITWWQDGADPEVWYYITDGGRVYLFEHDLVKS